MIMKKIGIMGGTFNPVHNAHLIMAQAAYEQYGLDEVWFMPSKNPPHKDNRDIVSEEHRTRMIKSAIDAIPHFLFSDLELRREGITYTSDTVKLIHKEYPKTELYFIVGGDSLVSFGKWHRPEKILKYCTLLAAPRGAVAEDKIKRLCQEQGGRFHGRILPVRMDRIEISSEQIRDRIRDGEPLTGYCPEPVILYMKLHGLFHGKPGKLKIEKVDPMLMKYLSATLRPGRYLHTVRVAETAASLAFCHCWERETDIPRAELAGMLHDCAKYYTGEEMLSLCKDYGIVLSDTERNNTALIHGKLGAWLARERYGVCDEEICSAISYHTTGKPEMTTLEKIIYIADYIEPGRRMDCQPYPLAEIRKESYHDLDSALLMILTDTVAYLKNSEEKEIDERTIQTYEYYKGKGDISGKECKGNGADCV